MMYKISELAKLSGVNLETIRYYERLKLITPAKRNANGYRVFSEVQFNELQFIKACRAIGFSLDETRELLALQANPSNPCQIADTLAKQRLVQIDHQIEQCQKIKALLEGIVNCHSADIDHCQIIQGIKEFGE